MNRFHFVIVVYAAQGPAEACSSIEVYNASSLPAGPIEGIDCGGVTRVADPSRITVNDPSFDCPCAWIITTPTETTSWGRVKSLYE